MYILTVVVTPVVVLQISGFTTSSQPATVSCYVEATEHVRMKRKKKRENL